MTMPGRSPSTGSDVPHEPVLVEEVVSRLAPSPGGLFVDATVGLGGHASALLDAGADRVIGIDRDPAALDRARARLARAGSRFEGVHADFRDLPRVLADRGVVAVRGLVADLGVSSLQLDEAARGFSFRREGPLDMRMDPSRGEPLGDRLRTIDEAELADVIYRFGEERRSRRVARAILAARDRGRLRTTADLAAAARSGAGTGARQRIDPATRTFQALRIWVNGELEGLDTFVEAAAGALDSGGRLAVIAFHSLEDRIVKHTLRRLADRGDITIVTRRPVTPGAPEAARNPRARSARLRVGEKRS